MTSNILIIRQLKMSTKNKFNRPSLVISLEFISNKHSHCRSIYDS